MTIHLKGDMVACPHCGAHQDGDQVEDYVAPNHLGSSFRDDCLYCSGVFWVRQLDQEKYLVTKYRPAKEVVGGP